MKKFLIILSLFFIFNLKTFATGEISQETSSGELNQNGTGNTIQYSLDINQEIENSYKSQVSINTDYNIDLTNLKEQLKILNPNMDFIFSWKINESQTVQNGPIFSRNFNEKGEKDISLQIYEVTNGETDINKGFLYFTKDINILVFEKSLALIYSDEIKKDEIENFIEYSKKDGIFIYKVGALNNKSDIELTNILSEIEKYEKIPGLKSNYITIWGSRDFLFNVLSKISRELTLSEQQKVKYNIVAISPFNINVLEGYIKNFLADKSWISKIIITNESAKFQILKENLILELITKLKENQYDYIDVNLKINKVSNLLVISKFINNLSNSGYSTKNIYLLLVIPIILTAIVFSKHFIGISPIGIMIPLFITLMFLKLGYFIGLFLIIFFIIYNFLLSFVFGRYNLLYGPKMSLLLVVNILSFIVLLNIGYYFKLIYLDLGDILYFIMFIIISERFINILVSKDLSEYKMPFIYTIIVATVCFLVLNISQIQLLILAYPELLILLVPTNFLIGKFSGLRVTEYFRFKEIIKSVEE